MWFINGIGGAFIGSTMGGVVYALLCVFFGDLWSIEAGGPLIVILSPFLVPALTGFLTGLTTNLGKGALASLFSCLGYIIGGIVIIILGAIFRFGTSGAQTATIIMGLLIVITITWSAIFAWD